MSDEDKEELTELRLRLASIESHATLEGGRLGVVQLVVLAILAIFLAFLAAIMTGTMTEPELNAVQAVGGIVVGSLSTVLGQAFMQQQFGHARAGDNK